MKTFCTICGEDHSVKPRDYECEIKHAITQSLFGALPHDPSVAMLILDRTGFLQSAYEKIAAARGQKGKGAV